MFPRLGVVHNALKRVSHSFPKGFALHEEIDIAKLVGPYGWGIMEHAAKTFPCPPCAEEGEKLIKFDRDFVNLKIDKPLKDTKNFLNVLEEANTLTKKRGLLTRKEIGERLGPFAEMGSANPGNPGKRAGKPMGLTACERKFPSVVAKIERCSRDVAKDPAISSPIAVCRATIPCPPNPGRGGIQTATEKAVS